MKQKEVFNKIGVIIKEINDQYKYLETNPDDLNSLELELFIANAHFLADHAEVLSKLNAQTSAARMVAKNEEAIRKEKYFEPVVRQPEPEKPQVTEPQPQADTPAPSIDLSAAKSDDSFSFLMKEPEVIRHELTIDDIPGYDEENEELEKEELNKEIIAEEEESVPQVPETPVEPEAAAGPELEPVIEPEPYTPAEPIFETTKPVEKEAVKETKDDEILTINQRIMAQLNSNKPNTTEQPAAQAIPDLKQAINLNDKMLYVKDLFNGYSLAYSEAIEILNRFKSFDEAERFLNKNYVAKNNWESKQTTTTKFYALLKRRYL